MRKPISKKLRFEVFKRDGFACQYCGKKAPEVILHVDHVNPVSKGGKNDILNLITSCSDCNLGKGPRELDDSTTLAKQHEQLEELNEKREQLRMMLKWREELKGIQGTKVDEVIKAKQACMPGWSVNETGRVEIEKWVRDFLFDIILDAIDVASSKIQIAPDGHATKESVNDFTAYIPRVAACKLRDRIDPGVGELMRLRGYLRTWMDFRDWECLALLKQARSAGLSVSDMKSLANGCSSYWQFQQAIQNSMR